MSSPTMDPADTPVPYTLSPRAEAVLARDRCRELAGEVTAEVLSRPADLSRYEELSRQHDTAVTECHRAELQARQSEPEAWS